MSNVASFLPELISQITVGENLSTRLAKYVLPPPRRSPSYSFQLELVDYSGLPGTRNAPSVKVVSRGRMRCGIEEYKDPDSSSLIPARTRLLVQRQRGVMDGLSKKTRDHARVPMQRNEYKCPRRLQVYNRDSQDARQR
ncbi:hypothetical protein B0H11DRAFT_2231953 [Mycena galericulata]|nr:hypothetical protein B0H11DRAFT_2231953 [Mycena galericulata]